MLANTDLPTSIIPLDRLETFFLVIDIKIYGFVCTLLMELAA